MSKPALSCPVCGFWPMSTNHYCIATIAPQPEAASKVLTREEFEREIGNSADNTPPGPGEIALTKLLAHDAALRAALKKAVSPKGCPHCYCQCVPCAPCGEDEKP